MQIVFININNIIYVYIIIYLLKTYIILGYSILIYFIIIDILDLL